MLLVLGLLAPFAVYPTFLMKVLYFALFASAFNLLLGWRRQPVVPSAIMPPSSARRATCAEADGARPRRRARGRHPFRRHRGVSLMGWVFSLAIRRTGIYFAMSPWRWRRWSLFLVLQIKATGGEDGLQGVPRPSLRDRRPPDNMAMYYTVYAVFCLASSSSTAPSTFALRPDSQGHPARTSCAPSRWATTSIQVQAAGLRDLGRAAGTAGATKTLVFQLASLSDVHWHMSGEVVLMTLLGGLGTILGPAVGGATIVTIQNQLADSVGSGDGDHGCHLRGLRAALPPRHRRRDPGAAQRAGMQ